MVLHLAEQFAGRVRREAGADPARQVERVYLAALGRRHTDEERHLTLDALSGLTGQWARRLTEAGRSDPDEAARRALTAVCHAVLNSAAFLYVD
jgi:hypothetical protein